MFGVASRATFVSRAATAVLGRLRVLQRGRRPGRSPPGRTCSLSHFARSAGLTASSSSRLIVVGAPWGFVGLMAIERPRGHFEVEAHHRLVDRADLLDVEGAVAEPLAVEDEQVLEHAEDDAVGDARGSVIRCVAGLPVASSRLPGPAFEERVAVRDRTGSPCGPGARKPPCRPPSWIRRNRVRSWAQAPKRWSIVSVWRPASARSRSNRPVTE